MFIQKHALSSVNAMPLKKKKSWVEGREKTDKTQGLGSNFMYVI